MEKLQKEENIDDELEELRDYGFNVDELINMLNSDTEEDEEEK